VTSTPGVPGPAWGNALAYRARDVAFLVDVRGQVLYVPERENPPLGYRPEEVVGRSALDLVHPQDRVRAEQLLEAALAAPVGQDAVELRGRARDGRWRIVELVVTNMLDNPDVAGLVVNMRDVTDERLAQEVLRQNEALYRSILETAQEGVWLLAPDGTSLFANARMAQLLRRSLDELRQMNVFEVVDPDAHEEARRRLRGRQTSGHEVYEIPFLRGDGERRWASVSASPLFVEDAYVGSLMMISDVTERRQNQAELERLALYDDLTGLPNRALLRDRLTQALSSRQAEQFVAVLFIDLDDFKAVNDSYGHAAGDEVLRLVAQRFRAVVREGDTLARFAGDEFVLTCPEVEGEIEVNELAQRVLETLAAPLHVEGHALRLNASIGVAMRRPPVDGAQLVRDADLALFEAKKLGRGRHVMFDPEVSRQSHFHLADVEELRSAIEHGELEVFYQAQVDLQTENVCSVEALVRWRHPHRGLIQPEGFIALAEASGLIVPLGRRVLEDACQQAAEWAKTRSEPLPVSVNISATQLDDETLPELVRSALEGAALPPTSLILELTETAVMGDMDRALRVLDELRAEGVHLSIDDFGTGYSSLAHLKRLPVEEIKIDREFVDGVDQTGDDRSIVGAVLNMAKALDLRVVAEGVETVDQADALIAMGCTIAQGYLYGRPIDAEDFAATLPVT
jgi:diguanylate cyclase (GGDEF)-like protein/PAS domain S-box-containing protein